MIWGSLFGGIPGVFMIVSIATGEFEPELLPVFIFVIIGLAAFIGGLSMIIKTIKLK